MRKIFFLLMISSFVITYCQGQIYVEPVMGYDIDLKNNGRFKQINSAVQFSFRQSRQYELIVQLQKTFPVPFSGGDSSFSSNPVLPVYAIADKTISPSSFSVSLGHRFKIIGANKTDVLSLVLYSGITFQRFAVRYNYDKSNYIILNPDKTIHQGGIFLRGGAEYMRQIKTGRLFIQINISTPPLRNRIQYPSSFSYMVPLSFNAGYSILIKK